MRKPGGFSLLELAVVLAVVALLAMMVVPSYISRTAREQIAESLALVEKLKPAVDAFHSARQAMPSTNTDAGLPAPDQLPGNYVKTITVSNGAFHIEFGNKALTGLQGKLLSVRPVEVAGSPASPISWVCGYSVVPNGMQAAGENRTTVPSGLLPIPCREINSGVMH